MTATERCKILEDALQKWVPLAKSDIDLEKFEDELQCVRNADRHDVSPAEMLLEGYVFQFRYANRYYRKKRRRQLTREVNDMLLNEERLRRRHIFESLEKANTDLRSNSFDDRVTKLANTPEFEKILDFTRVDYT